MKATALIRSLVPVIMTIAAAIYSALLMVAGGIQEIPRRSRGISNKGHRGDAFIEGVYTGRDDGLMYTFTHAHGLRPVPSGAAPDGAVATPKSQAGLEALLNDHDAFNKMLDLVIDEKLGDRVAEGVTAALEQTPGFSKRPNELANPNPGDPASGAWGADDPKIARTATLMMARSLNGSYPKGFGEFLSAMHPIVQQRIGVDERLKALNESQGSDGGFLVPEEFSTTLFALALEAAVIRPRARVVPMTTLSQRWPAIRDSSHATNVFGGVQAYWTPEAGSVTHSQPTFGQIQLLAKKLTGYTSASQELLADSGIAIAELITSLFGPAIAYFEDDAFINGVGAGQPLGLINADALITVPKETGQVATTLVKENLDKMFARMLPSSYNNAVWIANTDVIPALLSLSQSVGTGGNSVMVMNIQDAPTFTIYGRPVIFTEKCQTLGTAGDIYFVDLSYYLIGDRQSLEMSASEHVLFTTGQTVYRFTERVDGRPWLDTPLTPRFGTNTLSPFVALATRA